MSPEMIKLNNKLLKIIEETKAMKLPELEETKSIRQTTYDLLDKLNNIISGDWPEKNS